MYSACCHSCPTGVVKFRFHVTENRQIMFSWCGFLEFVFTFTGKYTVLRSKCRNVTPWYSQIKRSSSAQESWTSNLHCVNALFVHTDWRTTRDSVDIVIIEADRSDLVCVSEIPHMSYQHVMGFLKTGKVNVVLGGEWGLAGLILGCIQYYLRSWD